MKKVVLEGFPDVLDIDIEIPTVAELLFEPFWWAASAEDVYRYGGDVGKYLLSKTPLRNDKKHVIVWMALQLLRPGVGSIKYKYNWHVDGSNLPFAGEERLFLLLNDCTATTEFNTSRIETEVPGDMAHPEYDKFINENADRLGMVGSRIPAGKMVEFTANHPHRATSAEKEEFRMMFRVCESDNFTPVGMEKSKVNGIYVYEKEHSPSKNIYLVDEERLLIKL